MGYIVQFVGLTGFIREPMGIRALFPDGRFTSPSITPHYASISVRTGDVVSDTDWAARDKVSTPDYTDYFLFSPSVLRFPVTHDGSVHQNLGRRLRHLVREDRNFQLAAEPNCIASTFISTGTLEPLRFPNTPDDGTSAYLTQWNVPYSETRVVVEVTARKGWPTRKLVLEAKGELSIGVFNISRADPTPAEKGDHFQIYEELSANPVVLRSVLNVPGVAESQIRLPKFVAPMLALEISGCSGVIADGHGD